jgi:hypothetical protein
VAERLAFVHAPGRPPDHHRKLALEVQLNGLPRPPQRLFGADQTRAEAHEYLRDVRRLEPRLGRVLGEVQPDANDLAGPRDRRLQRHGSEVYRLAGAQQGVSPDQRVLTRGEQRKQVAGVPGIVARMAAPAVRGVNRKSRATGPSK